MKRDKVFLAFILVIFPLAYLFLILTGKEGPGDLRLFTTFPNSIQSAILSGTILWSINTIMMFIYGILYFKGEKIPLRRRILLISTGIHLLAFYLYCIAPIFSDDYLPAAAIGLLMSSGVTGTLIGLGFNIAFLVSFKKKTPTEITKSV